MKHQFKVRDYPSSKFTPHLVIVPKTLTGTGRKRKFFATRQQAEVYILRVLNPEIGYARADVREQVVQADGNKARLLGHCAQEYMERFYPQNKPTFVQIRRCLKPLIARHGRDPIDKVQVAELDAWLRSLGSKYSFETQHNYWRWVRSFFTHCHNFGWITSNPMKILKEPKRRDPLERHILEPEEMRRCLEAAKGSRELTAYLTLAGFAGIRTEEILRMEWDHIDWEEGQIWVANPKRVMGWKQRYPEILPALRRHLEPLALKGVEIDEAASKQELQNGRASRKIIPGGQRKLYEIREPLRKILGKDEWPNNCLRHSYKSYHEAAFQNLELTRIQMGHSDTDTTIYKYGEAKRRKVAQEWWAL